MSRRRLALGATVLLVLLVSVWLSNQAARRGVPPAAPRPHAAEPPGPIYGPQAAGPGSREANPDQRTGVPLEVLPLPTAEQEPPASVTPPASPPPELAATSPPPSALPPPPAAGGGTASDEPLDLQPRLYVHPRVPAKIVSKRKIDDAVLLQVQVGADGRVHDVRVLHAIPNCEECTQSAVEAARQFLYDPPVLPGSAQAVWTRPFDMRFSYRR